MMVRLPRLLDASLNEVARLDPAALSVSLTQAPVSTADMTLEMDAPVAMRGWIELYTVHGSAGIFRISKMDTDYDRGERRLMLEHGACALNDAVFPGDEDLTKTPAQWLSAILARQTQKRGNTALWTSGTVTPTSQVTLRPGGQTLLSLLGRLMDELPDCVLSFDQSSFPWTVSIVSRASSVTAEGRLSRNLGSVRVSYDDSDLCTRVYVTNLSSPGYKDADTVSTYGIVEQSVTLDSETTAAQAYKYATRYLSRRKEPAISVELDAVDLSEATGESLDAFAIGKKFRLALPSYGVTVEQWITGIRYQDVYGDPRHVTLTLANAVADLALRMNRNKKQAEDAEREATYNTNGLRNTVSAQGTTISAHERVMTGNGTTTDYESYINIKAQGIEIASHATTLADHNTRITNNSAAITVNANAITLKASQSSVNALTGRVEDCESGIEVNAEAITTKVSKGAIASTINQTAQSVLISASKINLDGYVTASALSSTIANMASLTTKKLIVNGKIISILNSDGDAVNMQLRSKTVSTPSGSSTIMYLGSL